MKYDELLNRAKKNIPKSDLKSDRFKIPKVMGHIQGNKTVLSNLYQISDILGREFNPFFKYLLKELATPGEAKKNQVILGRKVSASKINEKVSEYANKYVICRECNKPDTTLIKQNRIQVIKCNACGARYPCN